MSRVISKATFIIAGISILYLLVLFLDRRDVMEVENASINPPSIRAGDVFTFSFDARPLRDEGCKGKSITREIDSTGTEFLFNEPIILDRKSIGWHHYERDITSHRMLAPGTVTYIRDIEHWCIFLQRLWPIREHREVTYTVVP